MAFKNEYVPLLEQETSEFFRKAQKALKASYDSRSKWTIDREHDMVLFRRGGGHSLEDHTHDYWSFLDRKGRYSFITILLSENKISSDEIAITRTFSYTTGKNSDFPDSQSIACIKEALTEYKDWGVISDCKRCQLTLIDARTGEEI